jgi:hypothetical protein
MAFINSCDLAKRFLKQKFVEKKHALLTYGIKPLASNLGAINKPSSTCSTEVRAVNRGFILD